MTANFDLSKLQPGQSLFDFVRRELRDNLYPAFSASYNAQSYVAVGLLSIFALATPLLCYLGWKRSKLQLILNDGCCTRPALSICIPILWVLESALLIALTFFLQCVYDEAINTSAVCLYWWLAPLPLFYSYALATINVVASAPAPRRWLIRLNNSSAFRQRYALTIAFVTLCAVITAAILPGAIRVARKASDLHGLYTQAMGIIEAAERDNNLTALATLAELGVRLERVGNQVIREVQKTCLTYTSFCLLFFAGAIGPGLTLNRYILQRMARLENGQNTRTSDPGSSSLGAHAPTYKVQLQQDPGIDCRPAHRPFGNTIVIETPALPLRFQEVLDARAQSSSERVEMLRSRLKDENRHMLIYLLLLLFLCSYALFLAFGGQHRLPAKLSSQVLYCWMTWTFVPAAMCCLALTTQQCLRSACTREAGDGSYCMPTLRSQQRLPGLAGITMLQEVQHVEESHVDEKILASLETK